MNPLTLDLIFTIVASVVLVIAGIAAINILLDCYINKFDVRMVNLAKRLWAARK